MFDTIVPYHKVVSAARETAENICAHAKRKIAVGVNTLGGETASVAWDARHANLSLPTMPADKMLTRAEANQIVGLIAHECCHVMHSDWQQWFAAVHRGEAIKTLTNCIEDVRIEATEIRRKALPGLRDALSDTAVLMHGKSLATAAASGETIGQSARHAGYVIATLGRLANGYSIPNAAGLAKGIASPWRPAIDHALRRLPALRSTEDARLLAEEVLAKLQQAATQLQQETPKPKPPRQPEPPQDEHGDGQEGEEASGEPQDGEEASGEPGDGQDGEEAAGEPQEGEEASGEPGDGQDGEEASGEPQEGKEASGEPGDGQDDSADSRDTQAGPTVDLSDGDWLDGSPNVDDIAKGEAAANATDMASKRRALLNQFREATYQQTRPDRSEALAVGQRIARPAVLADSVTRLVLSEARNSRERYLSAGRFDRRAMGRATWGAGNVFSRRVYAEGIETALFLLIDGSTSMENDGRMLDARSLAYHLGQAIDAAGARCAIGVFHTTGDYSEPAGFRIRIRMAKDWNEPTNLARIAGIDVAGTTPLSPAIIAVAQLLADQRDVQRRILLPITDGGCDLGADAVRDACGVAAAMGVEVGAIGIGGGTDCASTFPIGVDLGSGANLSEAGLNLLVDMLERGRA